MQSTVGSYASVQVPWALACCQSELNIALKSLFVPYFTASYSVSVNGERHILSCVAVTSSHKSLFPMRLLNLGEQACPQSERKESKGKENQQNWFKKGPRSINSSQ